MAKGDRVLLVVDVGSGQTREFAIEATQAGRRVEVSTGSRLTTVTEVTRNGTPVRTGRFVTSRVVALIEQPREVVRRRVPDERQLALPVDG